MMYMASAFRSPSRIITCTPTESCLSAPTAHNKDDMHLPCCHWFAPGQLDQLVDMLTKQAAG
eukprot:6486924-Amphidinium_carterae.1